MKNLTVAVCIDERGGMMYNNRRQSRDRVLIAELVGSTDKTIFISEYSRLLFEPHIDRVKIVADPVRECEEGGICFVENTKIAPYADDVAELIIYNWEKRYPFDTRIDIDPNALGFKLVSKKVFDGSSHEGITKGVYRR